MKMNLKNLSLILVLALAIGLLAGCTQQVPQDAVKEDRTLNAGFTASKTEEDDKNYIHIGVNGESLKLEVEDQNLFDSIIEDEFYIFSYNEDYVLKDIQTDSYLKNLVENSMKEGINGEKIVEEIKSADTISLDGLTTLDEYIIDFNEDGHDEKINMYVAAERGPDGEIMWDDGQRWVLVVHGENKDYVLYDDYVQLGTINFNVLTNDDDFYITTTSIRTASFTVNQYKYNIENDSFEKTLPFAIDGNVNMLHSSNGY